jgi:CubicO group peptidase (beta-lactamase class C family)
MSRSKPDGLHTGLDPIRSAIDWLLSSMSTGTTPDEVREHMSDSLTVGRDIAAVLTHSPRFSSWRSAATTVEHLEITGRWTGSALIAVGLRRWQLDVTVEPESPHRIRRFVPRPVANDAPLWETVAPAVRQSRSQSTRLDDERAAALHNYLVAARDTSQIPGLAVAITRGGMVVHREALGLANIDQPAPLAGDPCVPAGSITKVITALGVLLLAQRDLLNLDDRLADRLLTPRLVSTVPGPGPTVRQTLLHQGGFPRDFAPAVAARLAAGTDLREAATDIGPMDPPAGQPRYSNVGYELLAAIITDLAGQPYADFLRREVLTRYGMNDSSIQRPGATPTFGATGYHVVGGRLEAQTPRATPHPGAGGMTSTISDLSTLAVHLSRGTDPLIAAALTHKVASSPTIHFAPGFAILERPDGRQIWRAGATPGFTADIHAQIATGDTITLVATKTPPEDFHRLARQLLALAR